MAVLADPGVVPVVSVAHSAAKSLGLEVHVADLVPNECCGDYSHFRLKKVGLLILLTAGRFRLRQN
jgi:hypothetical protein